MRFDFSEDTLALCEGARELLAAECTPAHVRAAWGSDSGHSPERWKQLAELGLVGLTVPEEHGGLGMDEVDLVLILEEAGRVALPEPLLETTAIAVPLLVEAGTPEQQAQWLPRIAAGDAIATVALRDQRLVPHAHHADLLIAEVGGRLHALPADRVTATPQPTEDGARRVATVALDAGEDTAMAGGPAAAAAAAKAWDRGVAGSAALLSGIARHLVETTVAYAKERSQFGRPVGSFQAVKHLLADAVLASESTRAGVWYAAYAIARELPDRSAAAAIAKAYASDAESLANDTALQVHGGIGFTWEHDLHLWLKRGKALERSWGSAAAHRARLAEQLFGR